jgi:hypothetical protein
MRHYSHRALSEAQEATLAQIIRNKFTAVDRYCPPRVINLLAMQISRGDIPSFSEEEDDERGNLDNEEEDSSDDDDDNPDLLEV